MVKNMNSNIKTVSALLVVVLVAVVAYSVMTTREHRGPGEKVGDAIEKLDEGIDNAGRELKDRTPAEKVRDEVKDATDSN
jgi:hypothetical protein